jgi:hypothetical protein
MHTTLQIQARLRHGPKILSGQGRTMMDWGVASAHGGGNSSSKPRGAVGAAGDWKLGPPSRFSSSTDASA